MIRVHHLEQSRSFRVLWLLEELALPYDLIEYSRHPKTRLAPPALEVSTTPPNKASTSVSTRSASRP